MTTSRTYRVMMASTLGCLCLATTGALGQNASGYVNVQDYIAKSTNQGDHTEAIRAAFAEAGKQRRGVLFPAGRYDVSDTIDIGDGEIVGQNQPTIQQRNPEKDIFRGESLWRLTIRGMWFRGGKDQLALGNHNADQGFLVVSECRFNDADGVAVRFLPDCHSTYCLVEKCVFSDCDQTAVFVSDQGTLRDCWISSKRKSNNKAVIENYGWLTCQDILGVPRVTHTDQRWIDNHSNLVVIKFRFGGEGAGFTPVVNFNPGASIAVENSYAAALGNNKRSCIVYCEALPGSLKVRNNFGTVPPLMVDPALDLDKALARETRDIARRYDLDGVALPKGLGEAFARLPSLREPDYGTNQLSAAATKKAVAVAVAAAKTIPSAPMPGVIPNGHTQVTDRTKYVDITPKDHAWDLTDTLDGSTELNSAYLAMAPAGDDIVLLNRMNSYPHVRIRNVDVDLDKTPYLTWRLKDNGLKGGHQAMKVINNTAGGEMCTIVEDYYSDQFGYYAYDLRKALGIERGKINVDLKFYLISSRQKGALSRIETNPGDYFLIDYIRLEAAP